MASDLDIDALKSSIGNDWSWWFKPLYATITNLWFASALLLFPCLWAIVMDLTGLHWLEGAGFMLIGAGLIVAAALAFSVILYRLLVGVRRFVAFLLQRWWKLKEDRRRSKIERIARGERTIRDLTNDCIFTFVHVDEQLRPQQVPRVFPATYDEDARYLAAYRRNRFDAEIKRGSESAEMVHSLP